MAKPGLSRGSISDRRFIEDAANNYIVEAFVDVSAVAPGSGLPAATDEQQYIVDAGSGSELGGWGTITGLTDKCIIKYNATAAEWQVVFVPVAAEQGATAYDKDSDTIFSFDGADWNIASGAGGGVKNFAQTMASGYKVGDWTTGNNATFGTAGSFTGSLDVETTSPLDGKKSFKYTAAAGSQNDWAYFTVDISEYARGGAIAYTFDYTWDGEDDDIEIEIWDPTITNEYSNELNALKDTTNDYKLSRNSRTIYAHPDTESQVIVGFHVKGAVSGGEELIFDNLKVTDDIGEIGSGQPTVIESFHATGHGGYAGVSGAYKPYFANIQKNNISSLAAITNDGTDGFIYTALKDHKVEINASINTPTSGNRACALMLNDLSNNDPIGGSQDANILAVGLNAQTNYSVNIGTSYDIKVGETISLKSDFNSSTVSSPNRQSITITATSDEKTTRFLSVPNGEKLKDNFAIKVPAITTNGTYDRATLLGLGLIDPYELVTAVSRGGAGGYTVAFRPIFSTPPICIAVANTVSTKIATAYNESTNSCEVLFEDTTSGVNFDGEFSLLISRPTTTPDIVGVPVSIQGQTHEQDSYLLFANEQLTLNGSQLEFKTPKESRGSAIEIIGDGREFHIKESGTYTFDAVVVMPSAGNQINLVKNSTTIVSTQDVSTLNYGQAYANDKPARVSWTGYLQQDDVIRILTNQAPSSNTLHKLSISKIGTQPLLDGGVVITDEDSVQNLYSARIADAPVPIITSQSSDFIQSVSRPITGRYDITFKPGFFTEVPSVTAIVEGVDGRETTVNSVSTTSVSINTTNGGSQENNDFSLHIQRQGDDTKRLSSAISSYTSKVYKEDPIAWQKKTLTSDITATTPNVAELSFNNLEIGKTYRVSGHVMSASAGSINVNFQISHSGVSLFNVVHKDLSGAEEDVSPVNLIFTATDTTLSFDVGITAGRIESGSASLRTTWLILEELPFHAQTSKWT